jgi:hypothetical protein
MEGGPVSDTTSGVSPSQALVITGRSQVVLVQEFEMVPGQAPVST